MPILDVSGGERRVTLVDNQFKVIKAQVSKVKIIKAAIGGAGTSIGSYVKGSCSASIAANVLCVYLSNGTVAAFSGQTHALADIAGISTRAYSSGELGTFLRSGTVVLSGTHTVGDKKYYSLTGAIGAFAGNPDRFIGRMVTDKLLAIEGLEKWAREDQAGAVVLAGDAEVASGSNTDKVLRIPHYWALRTYSESLRDAHLSDIDHSRIHDQNTDTQIMDGLNPITGNAIAVHIADTVRHITSGERTAWNNKSEFDGAYGSLSGQPNLSALHIAGTDNKLVRATGGADLTADTIYSAIQNIDQSVSLAEKASWNNKSDFDGAYGSLTGAPTSHPTSFIAGLDSALATIFTEGSADLKYEPLFAKNTGHNKAFGSSAGTVTEGNDSRLSDARTPLTHTHSADNIDETNSRIWYDKGTKSLLARFSTGYIEEDAVLDRLTAPPVLDPEDVYEDGERYLIIETATGVWAGLEDQVAQWDGTLLAGAGDWAYTLPVHGMTLLDEDTGETLVYYTDRWVLGGSFLSWDSHAQEVGARVGREDSTGLLSGGVATINTSTTFDVAAGTAQIIEAHSDPEFPTYTPFNWTAITGTTVTNIATQPVTYVSITSAGTLVQQAAEWTPSERRTMVPLAVIVHPAGTISEVQVTLITAPFQNANAVQDLAQAIGPITLSGLIFSGDTVGNMQFDKTAGSVYGFNQNFDSDPLNPSTVTQSEELNVSYLPMWRDGAGGFKTGAATQNVISGIYDDDSTGTTTAPVGNVPNRRWVNHRIYASVSGIIAIQYGQAVYSSQEEAINARDSEVFEVNPVLATTILRGWLTLRGNATDLTDIGQAVFTHTGNISGASGAPATSTSSLQGAYNVSTSPEIVTDATRGALTLKGGTGTDTHLNLEIQNNVGTTVGSWSAAGALVASTGNFADINITGIARFDDNSLNSPELFLGSTTRDGAIINASGIIAITDKAASNTRWTIDLANGNTVQDGNLTANEIQVRGTLSSNSYKKLFDVEVTGDGINEDFELRLTNNGSSNSVDFLVGGTALDAGITALRLASSGNAIFSGTVQAGQFDATSYIDADLGFKVGTIEVINSSRNLTNIGTGTFSGALTWSGGGSSNANNAYTHSQVISGNPHSVTASNVGLGNVTNESKDTMFTNPTFTGTPTVPAGTNTIGEKVVVPQTIEDTDTARVYCLIASGQIPVKMKVKNIFCENALTGASITITLYKERTATTSVADESDLATTDGLYYKVATGSVAVNTVITLESIV